MKSHHIHLAWYCLRTHPGREHVVAIYLRRQAQLEVYLPRLRYQRRAREGPKWVVEPLFPGYLFARFALGRDGRWVGHTHGVLEIVHFGNDWPCIPDPVLEELRQWVGPREVLEMSNEPHPGDAIILSGGVFDSLRGVVERVMPARDHVQVLLHLLGRLTQVEVPCSSVVKEFRPSAF